MPQTSTRFWNRWTPPFSLVSVAQLKLTKVLQANKPSKPNVRFIGKCADLNGTSRTATDILSAVQTAITAHSATLVTILGHSLGTFFRNWICKKFPDDLLVWLRLSIGAAIALLNGVYLPLHINGVSFKVITYGMPRVCAIFRQFTQSRLFLNFFFRLGIEHSRIILMTILALRILVISQHPIFFLRSRSNDHSKFL